MHADLGQMFCDLEFLIRRVADAGHLFAITQRFVVNAELRRIGEIQVLREFPRIADQAFDRLSDFHDGYFPGRGRIPASSAALDCARLE